jgi:hypothetical protein
MAATAKRIISRRLRLGTRLEASAFNAQIRLMREIYSYQLLVLLQKFLPRIEAGEFLDMGDEGQFVKPNTLEAERLAEMGNVFNGSTDGKGRLETYPGYFLLQDAVRALPALKNSKFVAGVLAASEHTWDEGAADDDLLAAECLANDLRDLWRKATRKKAARQ